MPSPQLAPDEPEDISPAKVQRSRCPSASALLSYLAVLFAVPVALYTAPFLLVRTPLFRQLNKTHEFRPLDFAFDSRGQNADVVIFGDSSAYRGIDPSRMSAALGEKVLNLPANLGELPITDDLPLRQYMNADHPPRLLISLPGCSIIAITPESTLITTASPC